MIAPYRLAKAELHCHLDGSLRPRTLQELLGRELDVMAAVRGGQIRESLEDYLSAFTLTLEALQTEAALERVMDELVRDCAAENVTRLEVRFSPSLHRDKGLKDEAILEAVLSGMRKGVSETRISCGVIVCAIRSMSPQTSIEMARAAVRYDGVCGFDLAGPEKGFPATAHEEAFAIARNKGLGITVHAGEAEGAWSVASAMRDTKAKRVGHGTHLADDPRLIEEAISHGLALEVCLQSNVETQSVPSLEAHPFAKLLRAGVCVTLNTDNRLMSATDLSSEYARAQKVFSLTEAEVRQVAKNGFDAAFM